MSHYRPREDWHDPPSVAPVTDVGRPSGERLLDRVPLVGGWLRRRRARAELLPALRRRVRDAYDVDHLAATVVRKGIVDPSEDVIEALAAVHLSRSLDPAAADAVPVAETERFVVYYGVAPDSPSAVSGPLWTLAREASYRQVHATFGEEFVERIEAGFGEHCRTLVEKGGWLVLAKPTEAWTDASAWSLTATRPPGEGYGIRGTHEGSDVRRDYTLTDGPLMCRTVGASREGEPRTVLDTAALARADREDPPAVWARVAADFEAWRVPSHPDAETPPDRTTGAPVAHRKRPAGNPNGSD